MEYIIDEWRKKFPDQTEGRTDREVALGILAAYPSYEARFPELAKHKREAEIEVDRSKAPVDRHTVRAVQEKAATERSFGSTYLKDPIRRGVLQSKMAKIVMDTLTPETEFGRDDVAEIARIRKEMQELETSDHFKEFQSANGFRESWSEFWGIKETPAIIGEVTVESMAGLLHHGWAKITGGAAAGAGTGAALGAVGGPLAGVTAGGGALWGGAAGMGKTSYNLSAAGKFIEVLENTVGPEVMGSPNRLYEAINDPKTIKKARSSAVKYGLPVGVFDALSVGLAGRAATTATKIAAGAGTMARRLPATGLLNQAAKQGLLGSAKAAPMVVPFGFQATMGMGGDATGQLLADGKIDDWKGVFLEGIAELGMAPFEMTAAHLTRDMSPDHAKALNDRIEVGFKNKVPADGQKMDVDQQVAEKRLTPEQGEEYKRRIDEFYKSMNDTGKRPQNEEGASKPDKDKASILKAINRANEEALSPEAPTAEGLAQRGTQKGERQAGGLHIVGENDYRINTYLSKETEEGAKTEMLGKPLGDGGVRVIEGITPEETARLTDEGNVIRPLDRAKAPTLAGELLTDAQLEEMGEKKAGAGEAQNAVNVLKGIGIDDEWFGTIQGMDNLRYLNTEGLKENITANKIEEILGVAEEEFAAHDGGKSGSESLMDVVNNLDLSAKETRLINAFAVTLRSVERRRAGTVEEGGEAFAKRPESPLQGDLFVEPKSEEELYATYLESVDRVNAKIEAAWDSKSEAEQKVIRDADPDRFKPKEPKTLEEWKTGAMVEPEFDVVGEAKGKAAEVPKHLDWRKGKTGIDPEGDRMAKEALTKEQRKVITKELEKLTGVDFSDVEVADSALMELLAAQKDKAAGVKPVSGPIFSGIPEEISTVEVAEQGPSAVLRKLEAQRAKLEARRKELVTKRVKGSEAKDTKILQDKIGELDEAIADLREEVGIEGAPIDYQHPLFDNTLTDELSMDDYGMFADPEGVDVYNQAKERKEVVSPIESWRRIAAKLGAAFIGSHPAGGTKALDTAWEAFLHTLNEARKKADLHREHGRDPSGPDFVSVVGKFAGKAILRNKFYDIMRRSQKESEILESQKDPSIKSKLRGGGWRFRHSVETSEPGEMAMTDVQIDDAVEVINKETLDVVSEAVDNLYAQAIDSSRDTPSSIAEREDLKVKVRKFIERFTRALYTRMIGTENVDVTPEMVGTKSELTRRIITDIIIPEWSHALEAGTIKRKYEPQWRNTLRKTKKQIEKITKKLDRINGTKYSQIISRIEATHSQIEASKLFTPEALAGEARLDVEAGVEPMTAKTKIIHSSLLEAHKEMLIAEGVFPKDVDQVVELPTGRTRPKPESVKLHREVNEKLWEARKRRQGAMDADEKDAADRDVAGLIKQLSALEEPVVERANLKELISILTAKKKVHEKTVSKLQLKLDTMAAAQSGELRNFRMRETIQEIRKLYAEVSEGKQFPLNPDVDGWTYSSNEEKGGVYKMQKEFVGSKKFTSKLMRDTISAFNETLTMNREGFSTREEFAEAAQQAGVFAQAPEQETQLTDLTEPLMSHKQGNMGLYEAFDRLYSDLNPSEKRWADRFRPLMELSDRTDTQVFLAQLSEDGPRLAPRGFYDYVNNQIIVDPTAMGGNNFLAFKVLLEEHLHALTSDKLVRDTRFNDEVTRIRNRALRAFRKRGDAFKFIDPYFLSNNHEFMAHSMFNDEARSFLNSIKGTKGKQVTSGWTGLLAEIYEAIRRAIGLKAADGSLLEEILTFNAWAIDEKTRGGYDLTHVTYRGKRGTKKITIRQMPDVLEYTENILMKPSEVFEFDETTRVNIDGSVMTDEERSDWFDGLREDIMGPERRGMLGHIPELEKAKNSREALEIIIDKGSEEVVALAKKLLRSTRLDSKSPIPIRHRKSDDSRRKKHLGFYRLSDDFIHITSRHQASTDASIYLHEIAHGTTARAIDKVKTDSPAFWAHERSDDLSMNELFVRMAKKTKLTTAEQAVANIEYLRRAVINSIRDRPPEQQPSGLVYLTESLVNADPAGLGYGLTSIDEFIAEAFSNPEFREILDSTLVSSLRPLPNEEAKMLPYGEQSVWEALLKLVADILNLNEKEMTILEQVMDDAQKIMELPAEAHRPDTEVSKLTRAFYDSLPAGTYLMRGEGTPSFREMPHTVPAGRQARENLWKKKLSRNAGNLFEITYPESDLALAQRPEGDTRLDVSDKDPLVNLDTFKESHRAPERNKGEVRAGMTLYEKFKENFVSKSALLDVFQRMVFKVNNIAGKTRLSLGEMNELQAGSTVKADRRTQKLEDDITSIIGQSSEIMETFNTASVILRTKDRLISDAKSTNVKRLRELLDKMDDTRKDGGLTEEERIELVSLLVKSKKVAGFENVTHIEAAMDAMNELKDEVNDPEMLRWKGVDDAGKPLRDSHNGILFEGKIIEATEKYNEHMQASLFDQLEAGVISPQTYNRIQSSTDYYVPFYVLKYFERNPEDTFGAFIEGVKAESFKILPPMDAGRFKLYYNQLRADRNVYMRKLDDFRMDFDPDGNFILKADTPEDADRIALAKGWDKVKMYDNGEVKYLVLDKEVAKLLNNFEPVSMSHTYNVAKQLGDIFKLGATGINFFFQLGNFFLLDPIRLLTTSKSGLRARNKGFGPIVLAHQYWKAFAASMWANITPNSIRNLVKKETGSGVYEDLYEEFINSGAAGSTIAEYFGKVSGVKDPLSAHSGSRRNPLVWVTAKLSQPGKVLEQTAKMVGLQRMKIFEGIDELADKVDKAKAGPKKIALQKELEEKMDAIAVEIRNYAGSPDFIRKGKITEHEALNVLFMFFNARVQGVERDMTRLFKMFGKDGQDRKLALTTALKLSSFAALPTMMAWSMNRRDKDREEDYDELSERDKKHYIHIPLGEKFKHPYIEGKMVADYIRIPRRESIGLFSYTLEKGLDWLYEKDPDAVGEMVSYWVESTMPVNVEGVLEGEGMMAAESIMSSMNPAAKVLPEILANRNFYRHKPIVPPSYEKAPAEHRYFATTPDIYKMLHNATTALDPLRIKHLVETLTAGGITQFLPPKDVGEGGMGRAIASTRLISRLARSTFLEETDLDKILNDEQPQEAAERLIRRRAVDEFMEMTEGMSLQDKVRHIQPPKNNASKLLNDLIIRRLREQALGLEPDEMRLKNSPVSVRSNVIIREMQGRSPAQVKVYLTDLASKKIITQDVANDIYMKLRARGESIQDYLREPVR